MNHLPDNSPSLTSLSPTLNLDKLDENCDDYCATPTTPLIMQQQSECESLIPLPSAATFISSTCIYQSTEMMSNGFTAVPALDSIPVSVPRISSFSRQHLTVEVLRSSTVHPNSGQDEEVSLSSDQVDSSLHILQQAHNWEAAATAKNSVLGSRADYQVSYPHSRSSENAPWHSSAFSQGNIAEIPAFVHRSISSPIFGSSGTDNMDSDESNQNGSKAEAKVRKRKAAVGNLKFPEAEPPAIRPRFQWYQGKGLLRVHLLVKNVLPINLKIICTGRDLEIRLRADDSPYPPTRRRVTQLRQEQMVDYHLPIRLPHRIYPDPEFLRISPCRVEIHYRKVKPMIDWSSLWKNVPIAPDLKKDNIAENVLESSSDSDEGEDFDENDEDSRPSKKFMNDKSEDAPTPNLVPLSLNENAASPAPAAVFIIGAPGEDSDPESSNHVAGDSTDSP